MRLPEDASFPPTISLVEGLFSSLDMSLPTPDLIIGTGGSHVALSFNQYPLSAHISTEATHEQMNHLLRELPRQIIEVRHPSEIADQREYGKIIVAAIESSAGPFWKVVYEEEETLHAFQQLLPIDMGSTHYSFRLSAKRIPDLIIHFPSGQDNPLLPAVTLRDRHEDGWIKKEREAVGRLRRFSRKLLNDFKPVWDSWYKISYNDLSEKMEANEPADFASLMDSYDTKINLLEALASLS